MKGNLYVFDKSNFSLTFLSDEQNCAVGGEFVIAHVRQQLIDKLTHTLATVVFGYEIGVLILHVVGNLRKESALSIGNKFLHYVAEGVILFFG